MMKATMTTSIRSRTPGWISRNGSRIFTVPRHPKPESPTRRRAREDGYVETVFGRRLYLPDIESRNRQTQQYAERSAIREERHLVEAITPVFERVVHGRDAGGDLLAVAIDRKVGPEVGEGGADGEVRINDVANVATSFPGFVALARGAGMRLDD